MSDAYCDITPKVHFLQSIRADRGAYWVVGAEGIDNALDAGATEVAFTLSKDRLAIQDNGVGITRDRELAIVTFGEHRPMPTTQLGRFGIGIKYQAVGAGNLLEVDSVSRDGKLKLVADWDAMLRRGHWSIPRPVWTTPLRSAVTGTEISIGRLRWSPPSTLEIEKARDMLAHLFYPALAAGRTVLVNGRPLPILAEPELTSVVEGDVQLTSGKGAHVRGGMMVTPVTPGQLYSVQVSHRHRVILSRDAFGCDKYSGLRQMFARVDLTGPWGLTRFKDGLDDPEVDALEDGVLEILRPVLEQCHSAVMSAVIEEMTTLLNDMLPPELIAVRPPRIKVSDDANEGHEKPKRPRRPHGFNTGGTETPRGPARSRRKPTQEVIIEFVDGLVDECGYGKVLRGRPDRIQLARDNPDINTWMHLRDKPAGARSLYAVALMLYTHAREKDPDQRQQDLYQPDTPFGLRAWTLAQRQKPESAP